MPPKLCRFRRAPFVNDCIWRRSLAKRCLVPIILFLLTCSSFAQTEPERQTRRRAPDAPIPRATIADMAWLAGRWTGDGLGGRTEEIWSPPDAGTMMGTFRLIRDE